MTTVVFRNCVADVRSKLLSNCGSLDQASQGRPLIDATIYFKNKSRLSPRGLDVAKRLIDIAITVPLLVVTLPAWVLTAAIVAFDGGPVFFKHSRVGRGGQIFRCLKFRTMAANADLRLNDLLAADPAAQQEWQETRKLSADPRITRVGRVLRTTSLDELPQLLNILRGDMSLVGPRPVTQDELIEYYGKAATKYNAVRPGLTGAWQVSGRSKVGYAERVQLDEAYVTTLSIRNDFRILAKTFHVVFRRDGAC